MQARYSLDLPTKHCTALLQVVKKMWEYIKANNLQNPKNKRKIILDDKLKKIFKPPLDMFSMNKQLSKHVYVNGAGPVICKHLQTAFSWKQHDNVCIALYFSTKPLLLLEKVTCRACSA